VSNPHTADLEARYRYRQEGAANERERIIKLLDNPYFHNIQSPEIHIDCEMCKTIALIKGEQHG
jgi:hypothetical protein